jgi:hypothetical protein
MKTILFLEPDSDPCSKYLFEDNELISVEDNFITVGDPEGYHFKILDGNSSNTVIVEGVTAPDDWFGCKYNYVNGVWELCPDWIDPREPAPE